jgi:hypothetical protein
MTRVGKSVSRKVAETYICAVLAVCVCLVMLVSPGCSGGQTGDQSSSGTKGTLVGAGLGALAGQAIGGDTEATLIGAAVGAGAGYIIGNEKDKKAAQQHNYNEPTPLTGTRWKIISLAMEDKPEYEWITVEFRPDGKVVSTRFEPGGTKTITEEKYRIVDKTLIIHKSDYIVNAQYAVYGNELVVTCEQFRAVLQRI